MELAMQTPTQLSLLAADSGTRTFSSPAEYNSWLAQQQGGA